MAKQTCCVRNVKRQWNSTDCSNRNQFVLSRSANLWNPYQNLKIKDSAPKRPVRIAARAKESDRVKRWTGWHGSWQEL